MRLESVPEVVLVLTEYIDKFSVVVLQRVSDLVKLITHLAHLALERAYQWVGSCSAGHECCFDILDKRFKNCTHRT